jgi:hypothetical protein
LTTLPAVSGRFLFILRWKAEGESDERVNHYVAGPRPFDFPAYKRWVALLDTLYGVEG